MTETTNSQTNSPTTSQTGSQASPQQSFQPSSAGFLDRRLRRSAEGKWIGGVCAGIERAYGIDAALLRVLLVLATLLGFGTGLVIYLVCWVVVPLGEPAGTSGAEPPALTGSGTDPATTDLAPADAASTDSTNTDPATGDPTTGDPTTSDPATSDPATSDAADDPPTTPISTGWAPAE